MALAWNEIKDRALAFSRDWAKAESEDADAKTVLDRIFPSLRHQPAAHRQFRAKGQKTRRSRRLHRLAVERQPADRAQIAR